MSKEQQTLQITMTPTQARINQLLSDGKSHLKDELVGCLWDEQSEPETIRYHISTLRKVLEILGEEIICEMSGRRVSYRKAKIVQVP